MGIEMGLGYGNGKQEQKGQRIEIEIKMKFSKKWKQIDIDIKMVMGTKMYHHSLESGVKNGSQKNQVSNWMIEVFGRLDDV